jgi:hypothetical protein
MTSCCVLSATKAENVASELMKTSERAGLVEEREAVLRGKLTPCERTHFSTVLLTPDVAQAASIAEASERRRGVVQLVCCDVGVPADSGEIGVAEKGGDETGVARLLPQPRRGGVTEGVRGDALVDRGSLGRATDDSGEDRRPKSLSLEQKTGPSAVAPRSARRSASSRASGAASGCRRGLPPLPRRTSSDGRGPSSSRSAQSSAISSARPKPVWTSVSRTSRSRSARPARLRGGCSAASRRRFELPLGQQVRLLPRLRWRLEVEEGIRRSTSPTQPARASPCRCIRRRLCAHARCERPRRRR